MTEPAIILPMPLKKVEKKEAPVKTLLSPEEQKLVALISNILVDKSLNSAYENKKSYTISTHQHRQAK
jgi:hypothetical protein